MIGDKFNFFVVLIVKLKFGRVICSLWCVYFELIKIVDDLLDLICFLIVYVFIIVN